MHKNNLCEQGVLGTSYSMLVTFPEGTHPGGLVVIYPLLKQQAPPVRVGYHYLYIFTFNIESTAPVLPNKTLAVHREQK